MTYRDIDWNSVWKDLYDKNIECRGTGECASLWASREKARAFLAQSRQSPERIGYVLDSLPLEAGSTVLDVGAGPGTLAVPLSRRVARVTAVEPAAGMADVMTEYAGEEGVSNLDIVRKRWEEINPATDLDGPYDLVIASYSLGMPDIRAAIEKMREASSRWVYLFWFAGTTSWEQAMVDLWLELHGEEFRFGPKADVLYNVLYSMGICPNVETIKREHVRRFADLDAAVDEFREQYRVTSPAQEEVLREYLSGILSADGDSLMHSGMMTRVKIWWEVDGCR
ncbi:MAG: class I SAM-dependent methyltransferase [Methanoculleus horonobensis]|nr:class I SAM-dependent methyltransferase [Methanoculleus horonobensis]